MSEGFEAALERIEDQPEMQVGELREIGDRVLASARMEGRGRGSGIPIAALVGSKCGGARCFGGRAAPHEERRPVAAGPGTARARPLLSSGNRPSGQANQIRDLAALLLRPLLWILVVGGSVDLRVLSVSCSISVVNDAGQALMLGYSAQVYEYGISDARDVGEGH
jgi:hypothetical protein